ncbi:hypothetical protein CXF97_04740 [Pseudomonas sp. Choline-02u-1]|nr:hypothetical protein CXF97_04740 [Pseudomonas sp. Choline-02u-1]
MWERACSRRRCISHCSCRLTRTLREQARSHRSMHLIVPTLRAGTIRPRGMLIDANRVYDAQRQNNTSPPRDDLDPLRSAQCRLCFRRSNPTPGTIWLSMTPIRCTSMKADRRRD